MAMEKTSLLSNRASASLQSKTGLSRESSSGSFTVEELMPDDMGYDADVEIIKPDMYEEVDSGSEDMNMPDKKWRSVDEELAARMKQLGREQLPTSTPNAERGRKRRSVEMDDDLFRVAPMSPELDVQELIDGQEYSSPAKRRRKKSKRPHASRHVHKGPAGGWTDSSEKTDGNGAAPMDRSTSSTVSGQTTPRKGDDDEMMDMT